MLEESVDAVVACLFAGSSSADVVGGERDASRSFVPMTCPSFLISGSLLPIQQKSFWVHTHSRYEDNIKASSKILHRELSCCSNL